MLLISCVWYLALLCHLLSLDMLCVNATCLVSNYHICELCNAILLQDIIYVNYAMPCCLGKRHICELYHVVLFCISHCFCRQCLYIQLLFLCISHLNWWWRNLEWKQGLQSRECYLVMQICCWLQIALQRPVLLSPWGVCSNLAGLYYSYNAYVVLQCLVFTSYAQYWMPSP